MYNKKLTYGRPKTLTRQNRLTQLDFRTANVASICATDWVGFWGLFPTQVYKKRDICGGYDAG
jgi:hypothetical protein